MRVDQLVSVCSSLFRPTSFVPRVMNVHWRIQDFLSCTFMAAMLLTQGGAACYIGLTTAPTNRQLFRPCSAATAGFSNDVVDGEQQAASGILNSMTLDEAILNRYSCKKFRRYRQENITSSISEFVPAMNKEPLLTLPSASESDPSVVQRSIESLNLARRTPTAFNTQPYKVVLITSSEQKMAISQYCLGPNRQKVRDSDCTAIFLADKQIMRTFPLFRQFITNMGIKKKYRPLTAKALLKMQLYVTIFSSGYPLPRFISSTVSFVVRTCMAWMHFISKWCNYPLPSLSNAETWSSKQVMMVAMTYMLACTARGLATAPMEGMI